jgi:uncharacterized membrane protein
MFITTLAALVSIVYHVLIMSQANNLKSKVSEINVLSIPANSWAVVTSKEVYFYKNYYKTNINIDEYTMMLN